MSLMGILVGETVKGHSDGSSSVSTPRPTQDAEQSGCQAENQAAAQSLQSKVKQTTKKRVASGNVKGFFLIFLIASS